MSAIPTENAIRLSGCWSRASLASPPRTRCPYDAYPLSLFLGALTLLLGYFAAQAWGAGDASAPSRFGHGVLVLAGIAFVWQMAYWNVLAF